MTTKIVTITHEGWEQDYLRTHLPSPDFEIVSYNEPLDLAAVAQDNDVSVLSVFVSTPVGAALMDKFPNLKCIAARSTGFDHIDLAEAKKRGVVVANVPYYGENTVAEFAFALLLAVSRRVCDANDRVREDASFSQDGLRGFDLAGKTIGIVGGGHIGVHAIRMARGFNMNVLCFDVHQNAELAKELGFEYRTLDELLSQSDVIMLHVPYNQHTHHLINMGNVDKIKKGAYLINTARGGIVETSALVSALKNGILAGAGLDVLEGENELYHEEQFVSNQSSSVDQMRTVLQDRYLIEHPNVVVTAHIAFNTTEAVERIMNTSVENIKAFAAGTPQNTVQAA